MSDKEDQRIDGDEITCPAAALKLRLLIFTSTTPSLCWKTYNKF